MRTPEAVAVVFGNQRHSYRKLSRRADEIARRLVAAGAGPERRVALLVERSPEMVAALLGILGAGAAYVPLDPTYPEARLRFLLEDSGSEIVLTESGLAKRLGGRGSGVMPRMVLLDDLHPSTTGPLVAHAVAPSAESVPAPPRPDAQNLAYVIYTSGSTGRPKGVAITRANAVTLMRWAGETFAADELAGVLASTSLAFDLSVFEIFAPLCRGGRIVLAENALALAELPAAEVTLVNTVPSVMTELLRRGGLPAAVRTVNLAGEALPRELARALHRQPGVWKVWNLYGPTEDTTYSTGARILPDDPRPPSIGRPIPETRARVLNGALEETAFGDDGELCLSGAGLCRGYLGRPGQTAERFVPDPASPAPGGRLYKTGDRARRRGEDDLEFLGRLDAQLKIRGFRIEPGEIEAALHRHPAVAAAAAELRDGKIVAYVAAREEMLHRKGWQAEHIERNRALYENVYTAAEGRDKRFDTAGWTSSYTRRPIPEEEMREWVDLAVDRVLSLHPEGPGRVLEIGCGTGLLLLRVAPRTTRYVGTDLSRAAVEALRAKAGKLKRVTVLHRAADELDALGTGSREAELFDTVILNGVLQHFPSAGYLTRVLTDAADKVAPGGCLFVGDVRSLPLLEAFCASVELYQAPPGLAPAAIRERARRRAAREEELLLDPAFFAALRAHLPRLREVRILPRGGSYDNELSRFRYDAVLHLDREIETPAMEPLRLDWLREALTPAALRERLLERRPDAALVTRIPNRRLERFLRLMGEASGRDSASGASPEEMVATLEETPYRGELSWARGPRDGSFDLLIWKDARPGLRGALSFALAGRPRARPEAWATHPLRDRASQHLVPEIRRHLASHLPSFMVPSAFVLLDALPRTLNGKLDRRALPSPDRGRPEMETPYVAPRTAAERQLTEIWSEVLGLEELGADDDFFKLGGHSLLALRVLSRVRRNLGAEIPLRRLFDNPTIAALASVLEQGPARREERSIKKVDRTGLLPLSFAQERLWFLHQLDPRSSAYNELRVFHLRGPLHEPALEAALRAIVHRHEILRTTFSNADGRPCQRIAPPSRLRLPLVKIGSESLSGAGDRAEIEVKRRIRDLGQRPFDLEVGPLFFPVLLRLGADEHALLLAFHHIVTDGWSEEIFDRELGALYRAFSGPAARPPSSVLPRLEIQYIDFAVWQRNVRSETDLAPHLDYWRRHLRGLPILELPYDRPRPRAFEHRGAYRRFRLPEPLSDALAQMREAGGVSLFMVLLAAFMVLLRRWSGQSIVAVGTPLAGRDLPETEGLIGFFVDTVVLTADLRRAANFDELLAQVREMSLEAEAHREVPFERLVRELRDGRDELDSPFFRVLFALHNPLSVPSLEGITVSSRSPDPATTLFDLSLSLREGEHGLEGYCRYSTELFHPTTIDRLVRQYRTLLADAAREPRRGLRTLALLTAAQRHQLLREWNSSASNPERAWRAATPPERGRTVVDRFAESVAGAPEAVALAAGRTAWSYRELDARAEGLARRLRWRGLEPDDRVGLLLERSPEMMVGLLGILKAGAAYVPLDVSYPRHRLLFMLREARCRLLLTLPKWSDLLALPASFPQLLLDEEELAAVLDFVSGPSHRPAWQQEGGLYLHQPERKTRGTFEASHLVYVVFTSGSTGRPKGVAMPHRVLENLIAWHLDHLSVGVRSLQFAPLNFDGSFHEIFATWCSGGTLVLVPEETRRDPAALLRFLADRSIAKAKLPVAVLEGLAEAGLTLPEAGLALEELTISGEQLRITPVVAGFLERQRRVSIHNHYGPSETHAVIVHPLPPTPRAWPSRPPIGRPIAATKAYVLDRYLEPVPPGAPGELHVGGTPPARGYFLRPGLTAERFLPDSSGVDPGGRMYRTGDRVRALPGGELRFLGRFDHQLKVRGFRVEPGEVETALLRHPQVREAVVLAVGEPLRLAAFFLSRGAEPPDTTLRRFLATTLPEYMVPASYIAVAAWPLTGSGKVDRAKLGRTALSRATLDKAALDKAVLDPRARKDLATPRSPEEEILIEIWREVLGIDRLGIHDHFFELGGHSLLATQVISRVRRRLRLELPVRSLFARPTVAELAAELRERWRLGAGLGAAPPMTPATGGGEPPLSFAQRRLWFLDQYEPGNTAYNLAAAWLLEGPLERSALAAALGEIRRRHQVLRTTFPSEDGGPRPRVAAAAPFELPLVDLGHLGGWDNRGRASRGPAEREPADQRVQRGLVAESERPFDLSRGPLFRAILWRLGPDRFVLSIHQHHIVSDGWSQGIFARELRRLYGAFGRDEPPALSVPPLTYGDFAAWQRRWLRGKRLAEGLTYARRQLAALSPLELPYDRQRPKRRSYRGRALPFTLARSQVETLRGLSGNAGASLFMTLLAAFLVLLHRTTGQRDLAVGSPIAHRNREEIEGLIGFFVNTLVLRGDLSGNPRCRELLARVREVTLDAYTHQDLPFEKWVEELRPEREPGKNPFFEVLLALENASVAELELPGLEVSRWQIAPSRVRFDLELHLHEEGGALRGAFLYSTDLFDATTIARMSRHFGRVLVELPADPKIANLAILTSPEHHQLLVEKQPSPASPAATLLHHLFAEQTRRTPDAVALAEAGASRNGGRQQTYRHLHFQASRLGRHLRRLGIGPEMRVGLLAERSLETVAAILAVLEAGGAYVPIDPGDPEERRRFIAEDADLALMLDSAQVTIRTEAPEVRASHTAERQDVRGHSATRGERREAFAHRSRDASPLVRAELPNPRTSAYILYTSGSTGRPKGAVVSHRNVISLVSATRNAAGRYVDLPGAGEVWALFHSMSFDFSVWELWGALLAGGRLMVVPREVAFSPEELCDLLVRQKVTVLNQTPSAFRVLSEVAKKRRGELVLRGIFFGGEALDPGSLAPWIRRREAQAGPRLINFYGITETTVFVTHRPFLSADASAPATSPLGRTLAGYGLFLLDRSFRAVPAGVAGEIVVSGTGLARGYLGRAAWTAERFVPDPTPGRAGRRLYRSGDLARLRPRDGELLYLGRLDHQVKVRGFRVEMGEIEAALLRRPEVEEAVVLSWEGRTARAPVLVACLRLAQSDGQEEQLAQIRSSLRRDLPEYMTPTAFLVPEDLPRLPSGKADRAALARSLPSDVLEKRPCLSFEAPRNATEESLAEIWSEVLGIDKVGIHDNFFELGGHSLSATRVMTRVRRDFRVDLPLRRLFEEPTVALLSRGLGGRGPEAPSGAFTDGLIADDLEEGWL